MIPNPDHPKIKQLALKMLYNLDHTPAELVSPDNALIPCLEFRNGIVRPNNRPPETVYVTLDGVIWRRSKHSFKWSKR